MEQADDADLVQRIVGGDHRAFRLLVERYERRVYTIAYGVLRSEDAAMDATQDAFVKVYKYLPNFKGDASFYTWLYRIVVNLCIDKKRKKSRAAEVEYEDARAHHGDAPSDGPTLASIHIDDPARAFDRRELREKMDEALDTLSDDHREILLLREVEGLAYEDIADTLDIPKGTVMSRLYHARKNFQGALRRYLAA